MTVLELRQVERRFGSGAQTVHALRGVSLQVAAGESVAVLGPSGSGKSTLLGLVAGLEQPDLGSVHLDGTDLATLDEDGLARLRASTVGVIFQQFRLLPDLSALENVLVPLELAEDAELDHRRRQAIAGEWLTAVGLADRASHLPAELSGGEQQRVAIARALAIRPRLIVADEPTGSLDARTGAQIADLLLALVSEHAVGLLLVTHDPALAERADRCIQLVDGRIRDP